MKNIQKWFAVFIIILVVVAVFMLGFGIHTCYRNPHLNDDMNIGPYCKKDISTVGGHFNLNTGFFEMNRVIYILECTEVILRVFGLVVIFLQFHC